MPAENPTLFSKLGEIPVMSDSWDVAQTYYGKVREYNQLTKLTFSVMERGMKTAYYVSTPVVETCQPQISRLNDYACNALDQLKGNYPQILQPSNEIKSSCVDYVQPTVNRIKPVITRVEAVINRGKIKVTQLKERSSEFMNASHSLTRDTVQCIMEKTLNRPSVVYMVSSVGYVIAYADGVVEKYIPDESTENCENDPNNEENVVLEQNKVVEQMEIEAPSPQIVLLNLNNLSKKIIQRMIGRALNASNKLLHPVDLVTNLDVLSQEKRDQLNQTISFAKSKMQEVIDVLPEPLAIEIDIKDLEIKEEDLYNNSEVSPDLEPVSEGVEAPNDQKS